MERAFVYCISSELLQGLTERSPGFILIPAVSSQIKGWCVDESNAVFLENNYRNFNRDLGALSGVVNALYATSFHYVIITILINAEFGSDRKNYIRNKSQKIGRYAEKTVAIVFILSDLFCIRRFQRCSSVPRLIR